MSQRSRAQEYGNIHWMQFVIYKRFQFNQEFVSRLSYPITYFFQQFQQKRADHKL